MRRHFFIRSETTRDRAKNLRARAICTMESLERRDCPAAAPFPGGLTNGMVTLSVTDVVVTEGNSGTASANFFVRLSATSSSTVRVSYATADGSAKTTNQDYQSTSGTIIFAPNEVTKIISVQVNGDVSSETNEYFVLRLSGVSGARIFDGVGECTIRNDDSATIVPPQTTAPKPSPSPTPTPNPKPGDGFQITLTFATGVPASVQTAARTAANRWEQVITGDLPDVPDGSNVVDDIVIDVQLGLLGGGPTTDGPSGVLANAGPRQWRAASPGLPWKAACGIDPADSGSTALVTILTHEFGHALGFPNCDLFKSFVVGSSFTGPNALREYRVFNPSATSVPLDSASKAHWDEAVFGSELMTPYLNSGTTYLSRITVGAMEDSGYKVDYTKADKNYQPLLAGLTSFSVGAINSSTTVRLGSALHAFTTSPSPAIAAFASLPDSLDYVDGHEPRTVLVASKQRRLPPSSPVSISRVTGVLGRPR